MDFSLITRTEQQIYQDYEHDRRLRMLQVISPAFVLISGIAILFITAYFLLFTSGANNLLALGFIDGVLLLAFGGDILSLLLVRRRQVAAPTFLLVATSGLDATLIQVAYVALRGVDLFSMAELAALSIATILAGVLGDGWLITWSTLSMNLVAILVLLCAPLLTQIGLAQTPLPVVPGSEEALLIFAVVLFQWIFAAIMFAVWRTFQRSLGELGVAYQRSRQLEELKDQFISSVNHELRTPLTTLNNYLYIATLEGADSDDRRVGLNKSRQVSRALADLVKSILSTRQIEREVGDVTLEAVPLRPALDVALSLIDPRETGDDGREIQLRMPDGIILWGDRVKLQQILTNLLSNAIKYSPADTPITVEANYSTNPALGGTRRRRAAAHPSRRAVAHPMVEIIVRDAGPGIPPEQITLLFNRFVRLPRDLASNVVGNGLGLYLCRLLTEAMGGRIWVESTGVPGEGAHFHLLLPAGTANDVPQDRAVLVAITQHSAFS
jgi:signal transduction histidine kinase